MHPLEQLPFVQDFLNLGDTYYTTASPAHSRNPYLICANHNALPLLDLPPNQVNHPNFAGYFSGNRCLPGAHPICLVYSGHMFGVYTSPLGDGRAHLLGQIRNSRNELWDIQLKGSGQSPYSRQQDGRATLRASIREYLACVAMHALGIPSAKALCVIGAQHTVVREVAEKGAILTRLAPCHIRFGSFEIFHHNHAPQHLKPLADYVIKHFYPHVTTLKNRYVAFLDDVIKQTALLIAQWQAVGFCHGVLNTDNMSIVGITLDYGPFAFMDAYHPTLICNPSDQNGRYAFDQQPEIGFWNLTQLATALSTLLDNNPIAAAAIADASLAQYWTAYHRRYQALMAQKLGLSTTRAQDHQLIDALLAILANDHVDYTLFFRQLSTAPSPQHPSLQAWMVRYQARLKQEAPNPGRMQAMKRVNPKYILRHYLAQMVIARAQNGDYSALERLTRALQNPFEELPECAEYARLPPDGAEQTVATAAT